MQEDKKVCQNCESPLGDSFSYCPNCGQKSNDDLTIGVLFSNTISNYFSYDARFLKSFVPLVFKPGFIAREFVKGKRLKYLHPAQYYLFVSVVFFFLFSISTRSSQEQVDNAFVKGFESSKTIMDSIQLKSLDSTAIKETIQQLKESNIPIPEKEMKELEGALKNLDSTQKAGDSDFHTSFASINGDEMGRKEFEKIDSLIAINASEEEKLAVFGVTDSTGTIMKIFARQGLKLYESKGQGILGVFYDTIPISMFFLIPIFALLLKLLYYKKGSFAHSMVFSFYFFTFLFIVLSLILITNYIIDIPNWIDWMIALSSIIYLWISLKRFYQQDYFLTLVKMGIVSFAYITIIIPFSLMIMVFVAFLSY